MRMRRLNIYAVWVSDMEITEYTVSAVIPKPTVAAVIADIHDGAYEKVLEEVSAVAPDVILIPGDIISGHGSEAKNSPDMLMECARIAPTFMSLGNHEQNALPLVRSAAEKAGVILLDDSYVDFAGMHIGGLTSGFISQKAEQGFYKKTPAPNLEWLERFAALDGYKLLLCHHPEYYPEYIRGKNIDMTVSGHAHGGQWQIFGRGLFAPGQGLFPKYTSGLIEERLVVSRGLANDYAVPRFFNPRELVIIHFESIKKSV